MREACNVSETESRVWWSQDSKCVAGTTIMIGRIYRSCGGSQSRRRSLARTLSAVAVYCGQHTSNERLLCLIELRFPNFEYQNEAVF